MNGSFIIEAGGGAGVATQAEAEAGTDNVKAMTPLRVAEAIRAAGGGWQAMELGAFILSPGEWLSLPLPVLPLGFHVRHVALVTDHGAGGSPAYIPYECQFEKRVNGNWVTFGEAWTGTFAAESTMTRVSAAEDISPGESVCLRISPTIYGEGVVHVTAWVMGFFTYDLP